MLNKEFKLSTKWKVSQIIEKIESVTTSKSLTGKKKRYPYYYFGEYDNSGFSFIKRDFHPLGANLFSSKFIEHEKETDIVVSIKAGFATFVQYIFFIGLISVVLFEYNIKFDIIKLITLAILYLIPTLTVYVIFLSDVKKAKLFLAEFFEIDDISLFRDYK